MPHDTGIALRALAGLTARESVQKSIGHLEQQVAKIRTPLSLGWGLLGLEAWGVRPPQAQEWVLESLKRQEFLGLYHTSDLSLLLIAYLSQSGKGVAVLPGGA